METQPNPNAEAEKAFFRSETTLDEQAEAQDARIAEGEAEAEKKFFRADETLEDLAQAREARIAADTVASERKFFGGQTLDEAAEAERAKKAA